MADRTSASIFGQIFMFLADNPDASVKEVAAFLFQLRRHYDFTCDQMDVDDALLRLGLAHIKKDQDGQELFVYAPSGQEEEPPLWY
jgi:hypothetical protein